MMAAITPIHEPFLKSARLITFVFSGGAKRDKRDSRHFSCGQISWFEWQVDQKIGQKRTPKDNKASAYSRAGVFFKYKNVNKTSF